MYGCVIVGNRASDKSSRKFDTVGTSDISVFLGTVLLFCVALSTNPCVGFLLIFSPIKSPRQFRRQLTAQMFISLPCGHSKAHCGSRQYARLNSGFLSSAQVKGLGSIWHRLTLSGPPSLWSLPSLGSIYRFRSVVGTATDDLQTKT